jgi:hypothetical protein
MGMGIFFAVGYGMPLIILGAAAATGVFSARYFRGYPEVNARDYSGRGDQRMYAAVWLAIAYPVVACFALIVPTFTEIQKLYGSVVDLLWLWAIACFVIGALFGWASCEGLAKRS